MSSLLPRFPGVGTSLILNPRIMALEKWGDEKHQKYGLLRGLDQLFQVGIGRGGFFFLGYHSVY